MSWIKNPPAYKSALELTCGAELEVFDFGTYRVGGKEYNALTGHEVEDKACYWCGAPLTGRSRMYCKGHRAEYYRHFEWSTAYRAAIRRAEHKCENCGESAKLLDWGRDFRTSLEVHHIVPLKGSTRYFSAWNLPWNLIVLCHDCHMELHRILNGKIESDTLQMELFPMKHDDSFGGGSEMRE